MIPQYLPNIGLVCTGNIRIFTENIVMSRPWAKKKGMSLTQSGKITEFGVAPLKDVTTICSPGAVLARRLSGEC